MPQADALFIDVVAADRRVWEGEALSLIARTVEGDIGILPNHEPLVAVLVPCAAEILTKDGRREVLALDGGFIMVADNRVSVLSQYGRLAHEILVQEAERELREADKRLNEGDNTEETRRHHDRATAQLRAAHRANELN